jgi:hypothetical protein
MAGKRKAPAKTKAKAVPTLVFEEGFWWIVKGTTRLNAGRNRRYAENMLADMNRA